MERLSLDFMNSDWSDYRGTGRREDRLRDPEWLAKLLATWALDVAERPAAKTLDALSALRDALWNVVAATERDAPAAETDLDTLNDALGASTPRRRVVPDGEGGYRVDLVPPKRDWAWARSEIAADFADLLESDVGRIGTCENDDCGWVFFDESKGRSRRWCDTSCSNLIRVRRFRERRRHA